MHQLITTPRQALRDLNTLLCRDCQTQQRNKRWTPTHCRHCRRIRMEKADQFLDAILDGAAPEKVL